MRYVNPRFCFTDEIVDLSFTWKMEDVIDEKGMDEKLFERTVRRSFPKRPSKSFIKID